jgi:carbamoyl-phosphate synthase large subunit
MNILITSAARKVWLVKAFQDAGAHVIACDMDELSPALYMANEKLIQPRGVDEIGFIASYCLDHKTDAIVPTRDAELIKFSEKMNVFNKLETKIIISKNNALINIHKYEFNEFCNSIGHKTPTTFFHTKEEKKFFCKPIFGSGSKGTSIVSWPECSVIQEVINEPEYTINVFIHPDGTPISSVPRQRIKVLDGESWTGRTVKDSNLIDASIDLCSKAGLIWHSTLQCFYNGKDIKWIEAMNRFGGGAPLSFAAGANSPQWIVDILRDKEVKPCIGEFKELTMMKYTTECYI